MINILKDKRFIWLLFLALIILGGVVFLFWRGAIFSKQILRLEIIGPDVAKTGEEITYTVRYKNNGNFSLEKPKLIFELPVNSLTEDSKTRFAKDLDDIYPGQEVSVQFKGRLLGKEEDLKIARAWLSYTPDNLSVRYESDTTLATKINSVPITLTYDVPTKVEQGKEISYSINYFSNVDFPLENLSIKVDPIDGFSFKSANPTSLDNVEWQIDTLTKGKGGRVTINGLVNNSTGSQVNFSSKLGMWQDGIFVVVKEASQSIDIIQPRILVSQTINGSASYTASPGETLNYQISLQNTGSTAFNNLFVTSQLQGNTYDFSTLQSSYGQANQGSGSISFDPTKVSQLQKLYPQQEIVIGFSVKLKDSLPSGTSQTITNNVDVLDISQQFSNKVNSQLDFSQRVYRQATNGIENFGPIPLKVNEDTSYAVVWEVKNSLNSLKNIRVKATLPQNVSLADNLFPEIEVSHFSFDSVSRQIVWSAGDLSAGSSTILTFQVVIKPTSFQLGTTPAIISQATVFADDQFTNTSINKTVSGINTMLPNDQVNSGGGVVQ